MSEKVKECVSCGNISKKDNHILTVLANTSLEFYVCTKCWFDRE